MDNSKAILTILASVLVISVLLVIILQAIGPTVLIGDQVDLSADPRENRSECVVGPVPEDFPFDPFYEKYCDAGGIPIISSINVSDLALQQAYYIVTNMLSPIADMRLHLVVHGAYFSVIGIDEDLTDLPEYRNLSFAGQMVRGLPGSPDNPITSTAEENLLCLPGDGNYGESIAVREFALTMAGMAIAADYGALIEEFEGLYQSAAREGLWYETSAISSIDAYWAEGVQSYFSANMESDPPDGAHNHVNTREELAEYDPHLYNFIAGFFNDYEWTPACPEVNS
jgi:alpha-glucosidase